MWSHQSDEAGRILTENIDLHTHIIVSLFSIMQLLVDCVYYNEASWCELTCRINREYPSGFICAQCWSDEMQA